jgi:23S rRNA maturation mini-RNase III
MDRGAYTHFGGWGARIEISGIERSWRSRGENPTCVRHRYWVFFGGEKKLAYVPTNGEFLSSICEEGEFDKGSEEIYVRIVYDPREKEIKEFLNTKFSIETDKIELYNEALTHSSSGSPNNQRLAFLGDSVLGFIIREYHFREYQDWDKGRLTPESNKIEDDENFARIATDLKIRGYMKFGGTYATRPEDTDITTIKAEAFEALFGAIYLDQGLEKTRLMAKKLRII